METRVLLGTEYYYLAEGTKISRQPLAEWVENIRETSQQKREDRSFISSWHIMDWSRGVGLKRITDYSSGNNQLKRLWDSIAETRWPGQITPTIEAQAATKTTSTNIVSKPVHFKDSYYCLGLAGAGASTWDLDCLKWDATASNWAKAGDIAGYQTGILGAGEYISDGIVSAPDPQFDLETTETTLWALMQTYQGGNYVTIAKATDASSWSEAVVKKGIANNVDTRFLLYYNNVMYLATYKSNTCNIYTYDEVSTITGTLNAAIHSAGTPTGFMGFEDTAGVADPFLGTREGAYLLDTSAKEALKYIDLKENRSSGNCVGLREWNNYLMVPYDEAGVIRYEPDGDATFIGLDLDDGLVAEAMGDVTCTLKSNRWFFMAVGGASATTYARIWAYDGTGWHCIYRHATANQKIKYMGMDAGTLHIIYYTSATATSEKYLDNVLLNPVNASGMKWNDDCYIMLPEYDGGMPEFGMAVYRMFADADGLSGTNEYLEFWYGIDGTAPATDLGDITASVASLAFGTGGIGITCTRLQPKIILTRSANTLAPKFKSAVINYLVMPGTTYEREIFTFSIDIKKSATGVRTMEEVITDLDTIRGTRTLSVLSYGRGIDTKALCWRMENLEEVRGAINEIQEGEREGIINCTFIEM